MSDFNPEDFSDTKNTTSSEGLSNIEKTSQVWSNAFKHWFDFPKLQKGIFTNCIEWLLRALFTLAGIIIIAVCIYIVLILSSCNVEKIEKFISQIGSIIISFGGWLRCEFFIFVFVRI